MTESRFATLRRHTSRFVGSSLKNRMLLAFLGVALVPLGVTGSIMYYMTSSQLMQTQADRLNAVRTVKARHIEHYFKVIRDQLSVISRSRLAIQGIRDFHQAVAELQVPSEAASGDAKVVEKTPSGDDSIARMRAELRTYYANDFTRPYASQHAGAALDAAALVAPLSDVTVYLQYWYLLKNSNRGTKSQLDSAADGSMYSKVHTQLQPVIRDFARRFGFYDVFLVDIDSGMILYSLGKEVAFATSLKTGPYAATGLGRVFQEAASAGWQDSMFFSDYEPYVPSLGEPASFVAAPVFDGSEKIGVLVFQMPIDAINSIMRETVAFGQTGEAYLVGPDHLFRTESRFDAELDVASSIINPAVKVNTIPVQSVFEDGASGTRVTTDYRDVTVLSSWTPVVVCPAAAISGKGPVTWALIPQTDLDEVEAPAHAVGRVAAIVFVITIGLVLWLSYVVTQRMSRESQRQSKLVAGIVENTELMASASEELSSVSELLSANAEQTTAQANVVSSAAEQVSTSAQTVATGVDNLSASIQEIAGSAKQAADVATIAVQSADVASQRINELGNSSSEIGAVVKVITQIAEQTNLLALNATIEAARAGEAGKGFAVVANEVKELARETAKATDNIRQKIESIQTDTGRAIEAIGEIGSVIQKISDLQNTIAHAVDEQTTTTSEMSHNVSEAAAGSVEIAHNITQVAEAARGTAEGASNTQVSAQELARMAASLQRLVSDYKRA